MKTNTIEKTQKQSLLKHDKGLSTVEYIIILVLIAVAGIGLWRTFGGTLSTKITNATTEVGGIN